MGREGFPVFDDRRSFVKLPLVCPLAAQVSRRFVLCCVAVVLCCVVVLVWLCVIVLCYAVDVLCLLCCLVWAVSC